MSKKRKKHEEEIITFIGNKTIDRSHLLNTIGIESTSVSNVVERLVRENEIESIPNLSDMKRVSYRLKVVKK